MSNVIPSIVQLQNAAAALVVVGFVAGVVFAFAVTVEWTIRLGQSRLKSERRVRLMARWRDRGGEASC